MTFAEILDTGIVGNMLFDQSISPTTQAVWVVIAAVLCIAIPYFLGSINFAIILSKTIYKVDIRELGSGNAGATNIMRNFGTKTALMTFGGDALKAFVSGALGYLLLGQYGAHIAGLFCVLGHMFPIYYRFKGGKGVLVTSTMALILTPIPFLILFGVFAAVYGMSKYISLGSVSVAVLYPVVLHGYFTVVFEMPMPGLISLAAILLACIIVWCHRENLKRISERTERKTYLRKRKDD